MAAKDYNLMKYFVGGLSLLLFASLTVAGYMSVLEERQDVPRPFVTSKSKRCLDCHVGKGITKGAIRDWKLSLHGQKGIGCGECHLAGDKEKKGAAKSACEDEDVKRLVSASRCRSCHEEQADEFEKGKHSKAWDAMEAMPETAGQPHVIMAGEKGCGGCHKIGRDDGKCDSCHTRHRFRAEEARRPEACATCHMGFDHPQWEMYSTSKHGAIYQIEGDRWDFSKKIGEWYEKPYEASYGTPRAPVCVTCHMEEGDHAVKTAWGFLGLRLPEDDPVWRGYRERILKGLGVFGEKGLTERAIAVSTLEMARLSKEAWQEAREKMVKTCANCHGEAFAREELKKSDEVIKEADRLMAEAIAVVEGLYRDGVIARRKAMPRGVDMLRFYEAQTSIEQTLYVMFLEHRMRAFQGAFHSNPDYMHWYGWAEMKKDLAEIREEAKRLRRERH